MFFRQSLRIATRSSRVVELISRKPATSVNCYGVASFRTLSTSAPRRASQEEEFATAFAQSPLYNVIKSNPSAMDAIKEIGDLMQKKGIDLTQPPSKMTMFKLAMDSDFRTAITNVMKELKAAGVDVTPENVQQLMGPLGRK